MIRIDQCAEGCIVPVCAQPGARRTGIVGEHGGAVKIAVTAPADQGKANAAIGAVLTEELGLKRAQVELIAGAASRDKRFLLHGVAVDAVLSKLQALFQKG